jgi:preprotein translocase subunit YajC
MFGKMIFPFLSGTPEAGAEAAAGSPMNSLFSTVIMIVLFGALIYFMMYRPQKKQEKAVNEMRSSLKVGDEISTTGGILGKIIQIKDDFIMIETGADRTKLKITKWAVRAVEHREEEEEDEEDDEE